MALLATGGQCPWCLRKRVTTVVVTLSVDDTYYELPLCGTHETELDRALAPWLRWAREVDPPQQESASSAPPPTAPAAVPPPVKFPITKRTVYLDDDEPPPLPTPPLDTVNGALLYEGEKFYLTTHARERMALRDIDLPRIRALLSNRRVVRRPGKRDGAVVILDDHIMVVLDTDTHLVVTVARRREPDPDY